MSTALVHTPSQRSATFGALTGAGLLPTTLLRSGSTVWHGSARVERVSEQLTVTAALPGVEPEAIEVTVTGRTLNVGVRVGDVTRSIFSARIADDCDLDGATARLRHGLLTLELPRHSARTIPIEVGSDGVAASS
jgi:HSP20 family molecular chaperone IbpA